jgi:pimeloyl-ACP methyl ester carboxylesterase
VAVFTAYSVLVPVAIAYAATHMARAETPPLDIDRPYDDVTIRAFDGIRLAGWHVPSRNGATVIVFPRAWATEQILMLARNGYGVLTLDMRGYGESEGAPNAFGWGYARDIDAAVAFLEEDTDEDGAIGGLGISVGGEQMLEAAAGNPALTAVMTEGAGLRSVRETFARRGPTAAEKLLQAPHDAVLTAAVALFAWRSPPPPLQDLTAQISPRAILFVHGEHDNANEAALTPAYHAAAGEPRELWEVPGAGHTQGVGTQPQEYEERMTAFFERHLLGR